ncbi:MAG: SulP family inorganic anion transporter [Rhodospirillaceae bacterium]|nr:SulP family inorganic anion transporter [Rhodospirillaceae bacterium]
MPADTTEGLPRTDRADVSVSPRARSPAGPAGSAADSSARRFKIDPGRLKGDLSGGLSAALVTIADSIPFGVMAFVALGPEFAMLAPLTGLYAAICGGLVAAVLGGTPAMMSGPRAPTVVIFAAMVATLAAAPDLDAHGGAVMAAALAFVGLAMAGALELLLGVLRFGRIIKFVPYPVSAGFMNGVAVLLLVSQARTLLGVPAGTPWLDVIRAPELIQPWTVAVGALTLAAIALGPRVSRYVPSPMVGMAVGIVAYYAIATYQGLEVLGPVIGELPSVRISFDALAPFFAQPDWAWVLARLLDIAPTVAVLALVASVDSLLGAAALDAVTNRRHNSNRELIGQGLGNIASAAAGGLPVSCAFTRSAMSYRIGARTRFTGVAQSMILLVLLLVAGDSIGTIPRVVLACILIMNAFSMIDTWSGELVSQLRAAASYRREILANLAVVVIVAGVTVVFDLITAVAVGVLVSMLLFVTQMSKSIVRRVIDGTQRHSLKVRERAHTELLTRHGREIVVIELDGPLFFGTADALVTEAERRAGEARTLILDFRRVAEMDSTGVRLLLVLARTVTARGTALLLAHITRDSEHGRFIAAIGGQQLFTLARPFADTDAALEWAEDRLVAAYAEAGAGGGELALADLCLAEGLWPEDVEVLTHYLRRAEFKAGEVLFREGEVGTKLFLLARGTLTIRLLRPDGGSVRLSTLIPGVMFGEMALLEGQPRSADAVATTDIVVFEMDAAAFSRVLTDHPKLAARMMANMAREIAARLRVTSDQLRSVS